MKKIYFIAAAALTLAGCNKWLDVKPRDKMPESEIFKTEAGFQSVLIGVYTKMAAGDLYGEKATMFIPEYVAQNWTLEKTKENKAGNDLAEFKYDDQAKGDLEKMWNAYYNAIAQVNKVIDHLENTDIKFKGDHKRMMLGEALGLRAFMHLDLLRFWGPMPKTATDDQLALPYLTKNSREIVELRSIKYKAYTDLLWSDLKRSAALLKGIDPIFTYSQAEMSNDPKDNDGKNFAVDPAEMLRRRRFNYYAAVATAARLCAWQGKMAQAADSALVVINAKDYDGKPLFRLVTSESSTGSYANYSMNIEHIFGLNNPDLQNNVLEKFEGVKTSATVYDPKPPVYGQLQNMLEAADCFGKDVDPDDIRRPAEFWTPYDSGSKEPNRLYVYKKYLPGKNGSTVIAATNRIPLLRLAEMYFYLIEGKKVTDAQVNQCIQDFCTARGISRRLYETAEMNDNNKIDLMEREWRKDFFAEGQMMFFYKRLGYTQINWPTVRAVSDKDLVFPIPQDQMVFDFSHE